MADIDVVEKRSQGAGEDQRLTWLMAALAILSVVGLMAWLAVQSDRITTAAAIAEQTAAADALADRDARRAGVEPAELGVVAADPDAFVGRRLQISDVEVAAPLGPSAFWGNIPGANPFLVLFSPNVTVQQEVASGQTYDVQGVINVVNDSLLNAWVESGAIRPGARDEAGFATHYLLAEQIQP
jgi:hypothetical protein